MSPRFPLVSGVEMIKDLKKIGYDQVRQRGSHIRFAHPDKKPVTVPKARASLVTARSEGSRRKNMKRSASEHMYVFQVVNLEESGKPKSWIT